MGPFPRSPSGNCFLLAVSDWFTKYTLLHPMRDATAKNVTKFLEAQVFLVYGVPQYIICDNGPQFAGHVVKELADKYQVQKIWFTPVYSPRSNFVERINRTIGTVLRSYVMKHTNWDKELPSFQFALNSAKHEVHNFSPSFLVFNRIVPLSGKYYGKVRDTNGCELLLGDRASYLSDLSGMASIFEEVNRKLHEAYAKNCKTYNFRKREITFQTGDKVWRRNKILSDAANRFAAKLAPKYLLSVVVKKISRLVYSFENLDSSHCGNWHVKDLKPYFGSNTDISVG